MTAQEKAVLTATELANSPQTANKKKVWGRAGALEARDADGRMLGRVGRLRCLPFLSL